MAYKAIWWFVFIVFLQSIEAIPLNKDVHQHGAISMDRLARVRRAGFPINRNKRDVFRCPEASGDHASTKLLCHITYYKCENWTPKKLYCDVGHIFDDVKRICRPMEELPHCRFDCSDKPDQSMHSLGCSRYFFWCWHGMASKHACAPDRYFNPINDQCDFRGHVVACKGRADFVEPFGKTADPNATTKPTPTPTPTPIPAILPTTLPPRQHPVNCSTLEDGNYPNPIEPCADHYFMCSNRATFRSLCPPPLFYNSKDDQCLHREDVPGCKSGGGLETAAVLDRNQIQAVRPVQTYQELSADRFNAALETSNVEFAQHCVNLDDGFYRHPLDCTKFVQCHANVAYVVTCSLGLVFNGRENVTACDYPRNVPECVFEELGTGSIDPDCEGLGDGAFLRNLSDCHKYRRCVDGHVVEHDCPDGLVFNNRLDVCDYLHEVPECNVPI